MPARDPGIAEGGFEPRKIGIFVGKKRAPRNRLVLGDPVGRNGGGEGKQARGRLSCPNPGSCAGHGLTRNPCPTDAGRGRAIPAQTRQAYRPSVRSAPCGRVARVALGLLRLPSLPPRVLLLPARARRRASLPRASASWASAAWRAACRPHSSILSLLRPPWRSPARLLPRRRRGRARRLTIARRRVATALSARKLLEQVLLSLVSPFQPVLEIRIIGVFNADHLLWRAATIQPVAGLGKATGHPTADSAPPRRARKVEAAPAAARRARFQVRVLAQDELAIVRGRWRADPDAP